MIATSDPDLYPGREHDLAVLERALDERAHVLVVAGGAGMGKTTLLRALALRAAERGWAAPWLEVTARTTEQELTGRLEGMLVETPPDPEGRVELPGGPGAPPQHCVKSFLARAASAGLAWAGGESLPVAIASAMLRGDGSQGLADLLRRNAPLLICVDPYRPSESLEGWFEGTVLGQVRRIEEPVAVVLAVEGDAGERLRRLGTVVNLGPLPSDAVRHRLQPLAAAARPPASPAELAAWVHAARRRPETLEELERLLGLLVYDPASGEP